MFSKVKRPTRDEKSDFYYTLRNIISAHSFESCCGVIEIGNFEDIALSDFVRYKTTVVSFLKDTTNFNDRVAMFVATLDNRQVTILGPILEEAGYIRLLSGKNKGYKGNAVCLYGKIVNKTLLGRHVDGCSILQDSRRRSGRRTEETILSSIER